MEEKKIESKEMTPEQLEELKKIFLNPARHEWETQEDYKKRQKLKKKYYKLKLKK